MVDPTQVVFNLFVVADSLALLSITNSVDEIDEKPRRWLVVEGKDDVALRAASIEL